MAVANIDQQYAYLTECGAGTAFVLDRKKSAKAEFYRLAKYQLWTPAGVVWCANWKACFGKDYVGNRRGGTVTTTTRTIREPSPSPSVSSTTSTTTDTSSDSSETTSSGVISSGRASPVPPVPRRGRQRQARVPQHFDDTYGTNYRDLEAWQRLCADVGISSVPKSVAKCKKALENVYINIYDFVDAQTDPKLPSPQKFKTLSELRNYSIKKNKVYPLAHAKEETFHRALLHVFFPGKTRKKNVILNGIQL